MKGADEMKENYEAPKAKLIGFAPMARLAADWDWSKTVKGSSEEETFNSDSEVDIVYPSNPEGSYGNG